MIHALMTRLRNPGRTPRREAARDRRRAEFRPESLESRDCPSTFAGHQVAHHRAAPAGAIVHTLSTPAVASGTYTVASVASFQQMTGNPSWASAELARVRGLSFQVGSDHKTFAIAMPNTWYGSMTGTISPVAGHPGIYSFGVYRTLNTGVGFNVAEIDGAFSTNSSGRPTAMAIASYAGNNVAAVINHQGFGSGVSESYQALVNFR